VTTSGHQEAQGGLFDVPELAPLPNARRAEAGLTKALEEAAASSIIGPTDAGLVAAALVAARALDGAEAIRDPKDRAYAVTALMPPLQRALHGLRIPSEVTPADVPPEVPAASASGAASWLSDELGPR
jgi:hypothetical protein